MAAFPILKTKAVAQYPASRAIRFRTQIVRFLDGAEQRYREFAGPRHQWTIQLDQLDEREMASLEAFFAGNGGRFATFSFTDPWDGQQYPNCSLASDDLRAISMGEMRGRTSMTIVENRA